MSRADHRLWSMFLVLGCLAGAAASWWGAQQLELQSQLALLAVAGLGCILGGFLSTGFIFPRFKSNKDFGSAKSDPIADTLRCVLVATDKLLGIALMISCVFGRHLWRFGPQPQQGHSPAECERCRKAYI